MRIAVDIDDTIADTTNFLLPIAIEYDKTELSGKGITDNKKDIPKCFNWSEDELKKVFPRCI